MTTKSKGTKGPKEDNPLKNTLIEMAKKIHIEDSFFPSLIDALMGEEIDEDELHKSANEHGLEFRDDNNLLLELLDDFKNLKGEPSLPIGQINSMPLLKFDATLLNLFIDKYPAMKILETGELLIKNFFQLPESIKILWDLLDKAGLRKGDPLNLDEILEKKSFDDLDRLLNSAIVHISGLLDQLALSKGKALADKARFDKILKATRICCAFLILRETLLIRAGIQEDNISIWRNALKAGALAVFGFVMTETLLRPELAKQYLRFIGATSVKSKRWGPLEEKENEFKNEVTQLARKRFGTKCTGTITEMARKIHQDAVKSCRGLIYDLELIKSGGKAVKITIAEEENLEPEEKKKREEKRKEHQESWNKKEMKFKRYLRKQIAAAIKEAYPKRIGSRASAKNINV